MSYRTSILVAFCLLIFGQSTFAAKRRKAMASKVNDRKDRRKINKNNNSKDKCSQRFARFLQNETSVYSDPFAEVLEELNISKDKLGNLNNHDVIQSYVAKESFNFKSDFFARTLVEMKDHDILFSSANVEKIKQTAYLAVENSTAKEFSTVVHGIVKYFGNELDDYIVDVVKDKISRNLKNSTVIELNTFINTFKIYELKFDDDQVELILKQLIEHVSKLELEREKVIGSLRLLSNIGISKSNSKLLASLIENVGEYPIQDYPENIFRYLSVSRRHFTLVKAPFIKKIVNTNGFLELLESNKDTYKMLLKSVLFIKEEIVISQKAKELLSKKLNEEVLDNDLENQKEIARSIFRLDSDKENDLSKIINIQVKKYSSEERIEKKQIISRAKGQTLNSLVEMYWSPRGIPSVYIDSYLTGLLKNLNTIHRPKNLVFAVLSAIKEGRNNNELAQRTFDIIRSYKRDEREAVNDSLIELLSNLNFSNQEKSAHDIVKFFYEDIESLNVKSIEQLVHFINSNKILIGRDKILKIVEVIISKADEVGSNKLSKLTYIISMMDQEATKLLVKNTYHVIRNDLSKLDAKSLGVYLSSIKYSCPKCVEEIWNRTNWSQLLGNKKIDQEMHPIVSTLRYMEGIKKIELSNKGLFKDVIKDYTYFDSSLDQEVSRLQLDVERFVRKNTNDNVMREFFDKDLVTHFDIFIPAKKVAIEVDGPTHYLTDEKGKLVPRAKDILKDKVLEQKGIRVIHIPFYKWDRGYKKELKIILKNL